MVDKKKAGTRKKAAPRQAKDEQLPGVDAQAAHGDQHVKSATKSEARPEPVGKGDEERPRGQLPVACFAPPLTDALLTKYRKLVQDLGPDKAQIKDALTSCLACVDKWWDMPESTRTDSPTITLFHGRGADGKRKPVSIPVKALEDAQVQELWDVTPWLRECQSMRDLFDALPHGTTEVQQQIQTPDGVATISKCVVTDAEAYELRNSAFHLLWHVMELTYNREPMTTDVIPPQARGETLHATAS